MQKGNVDRFWYCLMNIVLDYLIMKLDYLNMFNVYALRNNFYLTKKIQKRPDMQFFVCKHGKKFP